MTIDLITPVSQISVPDKILLAATTAADTSVELIVYKNQIIPVIVDGLGAGESVVIEVYTSIGTWVPYKRNDVTLAFLSGTNKIDFNLPGRYRLNKPVTAGAVGIYRELS